MALEPITRQEKIIAGQDLTPITRMEMFLKNFGGGGGGVQSDWNQNDDTQPDYVKNRPFYTGDPVETVLVEESTQEFFEYNGAYASDVSSTFEATVGETYKVFWDGTTYECICVTVNGNIQPFIGNLSIVDLGSDTGEPFVVAVINGEGMFISTRDTSNSHTISISGFVPEVVKIDEKYLPTIPADKFPEIPAIEFTTRISDSIANDAQPSFIVSNLSYSEIYDLVEKGNFQIKDVGGTRYIPIKFEIASNGSIFVYILSISDQVAIYAGLVCDVNKTRFYRNSWWKIEATRK